MAKTTVYSPTSRRAIVAPGGETYGAARLFQIYRELNDGQQPLKVFRTLEEAEAWLAR